MDHHKNEAQNVVEKTQNITQIVKIHLYTLKHNSNRIQIVKNTNFKIHIEK
jgi:hypothetical protein